MVPDLHRYDWIVVNSSAGKDSQASLDKVVEVCRVQGFPLARVVVAHADLGRVEWPGTKELAKEHAAHYGLRYEQYSRPQGDLLQHVEERGMWPSSATRFCTSDHKRGQIAKLFTKLTQESRNDRMACRTIDHVRVVGDLVVARQGRRRVKASGRPNRKRTGKKVRFLSVFGFRAEESPARRKMVVFENDERLTNTLRHVDRWLPIHHWKEREVWQRIKQAGTRKHWAYARGMKRLSCRFCIFAPKSQLIVAASQPENKELLTQYVQVEVRIGHRFKNDLALADVKTAVEAGETSDLDADDGCWGM